MRLPGNGSPSVGLSSLQLEMDYRTGEMDLIGSFFVPCFRRAIAYDRAVGFFRSTVLELARFEVLDFVRRGGRLRVVCCPDLTEEDINAITRGYLERSTVARERLERQVDELLSLPDLRPHAEILATLVAIGAVDLKVAIRPANTGQYHEKLGVFRDQQLNMVTFRGSSNETWRGWHRSGNFESFEVFCSWKGGTETLRVDNHVAYFERLWLGLVADLEVFEFPDAVKEKLLVVARRDVAELRLPRRRQALSRTPYPHQTAALREWERRGCRGILEHATGSGKTYTVILAIERELASAGLALVVVPSRVLQRQWRKELQEHLPQAAILHAGGGHSAWRRSGRLKRFTRPSSTLGPRIVLATLQTAAKRAFRQSIASADQLLLVVDEVHQAGSRKAGRLLDLEAERRLGLSATPRRFGDPMGTQQLMDYFQGVIPPPFTLSDAIKAGRLVPYEYYPRGVPLSDDESTEWTALTTRIARALAGLPTSNGDTQVPDHVRLWLIQRSRIAKKAVAKIPSAVQVLDEQLQRGHRWLVYCEDLDQLRSLREALAEREIHAAEYHYGMEGDPQATLDWFATAGGVLLSVRCLDEGVDIPVATHALILASSQNPRQFIQRRGRVLRKARDKFFAVIHDALVIPPPLIKGDQRALGQAEFRRALEFAASARNESATITLERMAATCNISLETIKALEHEEDE